MRAIRRIISVMVIMMISISAVSTTVFATGTENNFIRNSGFEFTEAGGDGTGNTFLTLKPAQQSIWNTNWQAQATTNGTVGVVTDEKYSGSNSLKFTTASLTSNVSTRFYCDFQGKADPMPYSVYSSLPAGVKTRVSMKIKTNLADGNAADWNSAGFRIAATTYNQSWGAANTSWKGVTGTTNWSEVSFDYVIPSDKAILDLSFTLAKEGTVWIDDVKWFIPVAAVSLNASTLYVTKNNSTLLNATVLPSEAGDKSLLWTSSDDNIATVSNGLVTGVNLGIATITATTNDGAKIATCEVTVGDTMIHATGVSLSAEISNISVGDLLPLIATVIPSDATDKRVTWTSSNPSVATFANGKVFGVAKGTSIITATTVDGGFISTATVNVSTAPTNLVSNNGVETVIAGYWGWAGASTADWPWAAGSLASVDTTTAYLGNNSIKLDAPNTSSGLARYIFERGAYTFTVGETIMISARVKTNNVVGTGADSGFYMGHSYYDSDWNAIGQTSRTAYYNGTNDWTLVTQQTVAKSGAGILEVNFGLLNASGTAWIDDVKVWVPLKGISFDKVCGNIIKDGTDTITAIYTPSNAGNKDLVWTSSDTNVATVVSSVVGQGVVTCTGEGTATITATSVDGAYKATYIVNPVTLVPQGLGFSDINNISIKSIGTLTDIKGKVTLQNITGNNTLKGTLIMVRYKDGNIDLINTQTITVTTNTPGDLNIQMSKPEGTGYSYKLLLWDDLGMLKPLSSSVGIN